MANRPCDKCRQTVKWGDHVFPGSFVFHTKISGACYNREKMIPCWEDGEHYYQVFSLGYYTSGNIDCPLMAQWLCISFTGSAADHFDRVKEIYPRLEKSIPNYDARIAASAKVSSLYEDIESRLTLPDVVKNLFIDFTSQIAKILNVTSCWVCGGPHMTEQWPWTGESLDVQEILEYNWTYSKNRIYQVWKLQNTPTGHFCVGKQGSRPVGDSPCQRVLNLTTDTWWPRPLGWFLTKQPLGLSITQQGDLTCRRLHPTSDSWNCSGSGPYAGMPGIREAWDGVARDSGGGLAPDGLFWICGDLAYSRLPEKWGGLCFLGIVRPEFFLLPRDQGADLGVKLFDSLQRRSGKLARKRRSASQWNVHKYGDIHLAKWGADWPPSRIIEYYGPASWAQDGSWGYRTPIYMLNRIIRLQAVMEIITNKTAFALELLAR
ncbi:endogenous retrovirus group 3 member 1 Env polyprotein-like [Hemiscyllium ocellatum]|uniref:endogenous retrovirus group 3 member 1 Env polyprotein-like n=1 Tax=Hemiscyllium ocellatum TaxID=170820 RepID=UPI0029661ECC|nr:endogenous retrovirus group 3 member 1 Env polyprotein-like [Hemiscyllium ocellatum]